MLIKNSGLVVYWILCLVSSLTYGLEVNNTQNIGNKTITPVQPEPATNASTVVVTTKPELVLTSAKPNVEQGEKTSIVPPSTVKPDPDDANTTHITQSTSEIPSTSSTTATPDKKSTTAVPPSSSIAPNISTSSEPITNKPTVSTSTRIPSSTNIPLTTPPPPPAHHRQFDGASFIGGIILTAGLMAIGFVGFKFYKTRTERNYHTL